MDGRIGSAETPLEAVHQQRGNTSTLDTGVSSGIDAMQIPRVGAGVDLQSFTVHRAWQRASGQGRHTGVAASPAACGATQAAGASAQALLVAAWAATACGAETNNQASRRPIKHDWRQREVVTRATAGRPETGLRNIDDTRMSCLSF